jgi:tripartite-type tricarboxylate transporter receptor subunit TctC
MSRVSRAVVIATLAALSCLPSLALGQAPYPSQVIKLVVPSAAGSPTDVVARVVGQALQSRIGQSVIVENRPGAGQTTGTKFVATAAPDGYTLLFGGDVLGYFPVTYPNFNFDPVKSLTPVATAVTWSHVLVVAPSVPAKTIPELVAYAKSNPGKLIFGLRYGTTPHILADAFRRATGADILFVPYTSGEQARADLLGGRVHLNFAPAANLLALIDDGKARPLAYTGAARSPLLPEVPTMSESGLPQVGFNPDVWLGIFGPAGLPAATVTKLNDAVNDSLKSEALRATLAKLGVEPHPSTPQEFAAFFAAEIKKWPLLRDAGLKSE